jgi:hypothetical protein
VNFIVNHLYGLGRAVAWWLRHYAISWKVEDSSPDKVIEIFNLPNPSSLTMAFGIIHSLTEMSARNRKKNVCGE